MYAKAQRSLRMRDASTLTRTPDTTKLFVCFLPGIDRRLLYAENAPYIAGLFASHPWTSTTSIPSAELVSTIMTGMLPHEHGVWQLKWRPAPPRSLMDRLIDKLPDLVTTTVQCVIHLVMRCYEIPTIPPKRLRQMEFTRLKFHGHADTDDLRARLRGADSIFTAVGPQYSRYYFTDRFNDRARLLQEMCSGTYRLEVLQFHSMDVMGHWILDTPEKIRTFYRLTDAFVRALHTKCQANGLTMVLLSDHGQEAVKETIDLRGAFTTLGIPADEYAFFLQPAMARFWFHTDRARQAITGMLAKTAHATVLPYQELRRYGIEFSDAQYGEVYSVPDAGYAFFPHDFYHPLTTLYVGLTDWQQRRRLRDPRYLTYHGYLPDHDCEQGFMLVLDKTYQVDAPDINLIDIAPSLLAMTGDRIPSSMKGVVRFHR